MNDDAAVSKARSQADAMYASDTAIQALGIEIGDVKPGYAEARMTVAASMINGHDVCHGGYLFTLADTAFAYACNTHGAPTVAAAASIEFLRPARLGDELVAIATEVQRGKRSGICDVRVSRGDGQLIALFRGRSAVLRPTSDRPNTTQK